MKKTRIFIAVLLGLSLLYAPAAIAASMDIGLAWVGKSGMATRVTEGFDRGISELAPDIKIEYQKELASLDDLGPLVDRWQQEKKALVILRSNGAKWLGKTPPALPTFIGGCNHPGQLGAVKNLQAPEGNITGVTYFLNVDAQFEIFKAILPNLTSVLLLLEEGHPSSAIDREETMAVCDKLGIAYTDKFVASQEEAVSTVEQFKGKVSAIIIGNQALNIDNAENIVKAAGKTPVFSYSSKPVTAGALGGFVADDVKLGYMLAQSLVDVIINGKPIKEIPVKVDPKPKFYVNAKTAQKIGAEIPFEILESATVIE